MHAFDRFRHVLRPAERRIASEFLSACGFSGPELALLLRRGRLRRVTPGELLTRIGSHRRELTLVFDGSLRASRADGTSELLNASQGACEILGELSVFGDRTYQVADVVALTSATTFVLPGSCREEFERSAPTLMALVETARLPRRESLEESQRASREKSYQGYLAFQEAWARVVADR